MNDDNSKMTTKPKLSGKRGSGHLGDVTRKVIEASEITLSRSKKRKNGNGNILNFGNQKSVDAQLQSYSQAMPLVSQQRCPNKSSYVEESKKTFSVIGASSNETCVRSRYNKTYASLSKIGILNHIKTKQSIAANDVTLIETSETSKDSEFDNAVEDGVGKEKQQLVSDSADRLLTVSSNMQVTDCEEGRKHNVTQVADSNSENGKGCLIYVQSPSFPDVKTLRTKAEESWSVIMVGEDQVSDSECSTGKCNTLSSVISTELVSHFNHSHNPVLKPVAKVTGISTTTSSMPSLSGSTSAITAISTPIPTFPKLPELFGDVSKGEVDRLGQAILTSRREDCCPASTSQQMDKPDTGCISDEDKDKLDLASPESFHRSQESVFPLKNRDPCSGAPFLVADMSSGSGSLSLREQSSDSQADDMSDIKTDLDSPETIKSNFNSQQPSFLQVDTWAAHMLQNLELLYVNERHCDLILKFGGGEVLKVHRTILLACTSLVPDAMQGKNELVVPEDLKFASVEPVIRFVYSGRLEIQKSTKEMSAIYVAAKRLQVSLLTHIMDHHFPYLCPSYVESLTSQGDSKSSISTTLPSKGFPGSPLQGSSCKSTANKSTLVATLEGDEPDTDTKSFEDTDDIKEIKEEECEVQDASMYYLVADSRKYSYASSKGRFIKTSEEARPTRFELEEDSENFSLKAATWCTNSSSSSPPYVLPKAPQNRSPSSNLKVEKHQPHITGHICDEHQAVGLADSTNQSLELDHHLGASSESSKCGSVADIHEDYQTIKNESRKENVELMEKVSSICRQLEEKEPNDLNELQETIFKGEKSDEKSHSLSIDNKAHQKEESLIESSLTPDVAVPVKSILRKSKNKARVCKEAKHVSFQLDENNDLINEVATFSLSKEPAQSLIEVQKTKGSRKSLSDTHSPVKLTVSMKKKVLMNLSLSDSETISSPSLPGKKSYGKKSVSSSQGHSKNPVNKGDINSHAKIISEVLKKYPHLVKDKKKIRLKILKKGNEKEGGGKGKSKVQYLVLSDGDSKSKSVTKTQKASSLSKHDTSIPQRVHNQHPFECPECNNTTFKTYFMLKKHVTAEHKDKISAILSRIENIPYACYTCFVNEPLEFGDYYSYQQHMKDVHSKTEQRLCNLCGFKPGRKLDFAYHQYTEHNKVSKSFCFPKCDLCDHVAINDAALLKHRSQHTNADNYTCSVCGVKFCSFGALQGHMQTKMCQTKPSVSHKCPQCPLTFARSYNLKAHYKSSHKSLQTTVQSTSAAREKQSRDLILHNAKAQSEEAERENAIMKTNNSSSISEKDNINAEVECENPTAVNTQSSSEAEALSTVASSLAASLGLPEETINHYMYSQDNKMDYSNTMDGEKVEQVVSQPVDLAVHLEVPSVSEYQDHTQCYEKPYSVQTSVQDSTNMSALFPISVVSNEALPSQIVPGQILPSQILEAGCMNSPNGPVLGGAPQSWTYVTYQVPSTSDDLPVVLTETTSINAPSGSPHQSTSTENVFHSTTNMTIVEDMEVNASDVRCTESATIMCEDLTTVTGTDTEMNRNASQTSSLPETHTYDSLSSQFV